MSPIVCPRPRSATSSSSLHKSPSAPSSVPCVTVDVTPPRLLSPIHLDSAVASSSSCKRTVPPSSCSSKRRRSTHDLIYHHSPRRQRHCSRGDYQLTSLGVFDRMPRWASREESFMDVGDLGMTDALEWSVPGYGNSEYSEPSSAGPIRTRRRPIGLEPDSPPHKDHSSHPRALFPRQELLSLPPRTPPRRPAILSDVQFRNLLPVLP
ncbi:hypothetical protein NEOLEDRAFT_1177690 [Neolentinus lepideus HHB14362 ss-1]|uniref:Uncharacterized protein n=1 Tax=Neolentinus lepideus HHB14362 ss-1 TaxID=1314782 RepID=A0A165T7Y0_9AGAM|nr:hypothetical protein NEOLEDRAFT_1177690 [Neolentinus lepideus HHB14362 ss-1]